MGKRTMTLKNPSIGWCIGGFFMFFEVWFVNSFQIIIVDFFIRKV